MRTGDRLVPQREIDGQDEAARGGNPACGRGTPIGRAIDAPDEEQHRNRVERAEERGGGGRDIRETDEDGGERDGEDATKANQMEHGAPTVAFLRRHARVVPVCIKLVGLAGRLEPCYAVWILV